MKDAVSLLVMIAALVLVIFITLKLFVTNPIADKESEKKKKMEAALESDVSNYSKTQTTTVTDDADSETAAKQGGGFQW